MHNTTKYAHHHLLSQALIKSEHSNYYIAQLKEKKKRSNKKTKLLTVSAIEKKELIASKRKEAETPCKEKRTTNNEHEKNGNETKQNWKWIVLTKRARESVYFKWNIQTWMSSTLNFISLKWFDCAVCVRFNCKSTQPSNSPTYVMRYCIYLNVINAIPKTGSLQTERVIVLHRELIIIRSDQLC